LDRGDVRQAGNFIILYQLAKMILIRAANLQLKEKIVPAFKKAHGMGYQALFVIDNSQGHSAYLEDALVIL